MRWFWGVLAVLLLVVLGVAMLPMRWVTERYVPDLEADTVAGSIWDARLSNARYQGVPLGDIETGLMLGDLMGGRAAVRFRSGDREAGREVVRGLFVATQTTRGVEGVQGRFAVPLLPAPLPPVRVTVRDGAVALDGAGRCQAASGAVSASIEGVPRLGTVPLMEGVARCDGPDLLLPMVAPGEAMRLQMRVRTGGSWTAELGVPAGDPMRAGVLAMMGFRRGEGGQMLWQVEGQGGAVTAWRGRG